MTASGKANPRLMTLSNEEQLGVSATKDRRLGASSSKEQGLTFNSILMKNGMLKTSQSVANL